MRQDKSKEWNAKQAQWDKAENEFIYKLKAPYGEICLGYWDTDEIDIEGTYTIEMLEKIVAAYKKMKAEIK